MSEKEKQTPKVTLTGITKEAERKAQPSGKENKDSLINQFRALRAERSRIRPVVKK